MPSRPLSPTPLTPTHNYHYRVLLAAAAGSSALVAVFFILLFLYLYFSLRRRRSPTLPFDFPSPLIRRYSYRDLRSATASFDPARLLGRGASASVFRGLLPDGKSIAVKSSSPLSDLELKNELAVLSSLRRPSPFVVSLLGHCDHRDRRLLVYEFMPNGSLQDALFSPRSDLRWDLRFQIILDVARGLEFLHLECDPPVVHGDIKPSNVLLGSEFRAKIADFGLARLKADEIDHHPPSAVAIDEFSQDLGSVSPAAAAAAIDFDFELGFEFSRGRVRSNPIADSVENSKELNDGDWWWKQEGSSELNSRDYVSEWIGGQICTPSNDDLDKPQDKKNADACSKKGGSAREWWKEEYFEEMSRKGKLNKGLHWFRKDGNADRAAAKKKRRRSKSVGSDDLFSRELSSTATSARGTICYVAPEHGGCGRFLEKADVYSFGVLVLVIVSGRRPLHVLSSPMRLERANLVSWCRQLAGSGDVLDLVDERLRDAFDKEQASVCIGLALLCLQKLPELRPDSGEIVRMLVGEMDVPAAPPADFSPSPNSRRFSKSRRRSGHDPE